jgi:hypothetical protein
MLAVSPSPSPPDIREIIPAQPYYIPGANLLWLALALAGVLLVVGLLWYLRRRPPAASAASRWSPREAANRRLQELERTGEALEPRLFGVEVSAILRAYIGAQFGLQPERQTSPEFLAAIIHARVFTEAEKTLLADFLAQCDLLKFAREDAGGEARRALLAQARQFLQPAPPPPLPAAGLRAAA